MIERSPYTLDAVQLEKAEQALQKAAETLRPRPSEERLYLVLGVFVRIAVATFAGAALALFLAEVLPDVGEDIPPTLVFFCLMGFLFLFISAAAGAILFLVLNLSVVIRAFRQRRLLKKLGIREISLSAWRLQRRGRRWSRLARAVLTWVGILCLISSVGAVIDMISPSLDKKDLSVSTFLAGLFFASGVTILVWRFVQRSREQ
jgi:hypothetical protein